MNQAAMKIVGGRNLPPLWDRFDRLQRTAQLLLGRGICPKGVFRFKTFQEFDEWKKKLHQELPKQNDLVRLCAALNAQDASYIGLLKN